MCDIVITGNKVIIKLLDLQWVLLFISYPDGTLVLMTQIFQKILNWSKLKFECL